MNGVTSYFEVRKPTWEEYEDQNILKIECTAEAPPWDPSSPDYSQQEQSMFNYRVQYVSPNTPAWGQLYINSVTSYAYDAADVMNNDNYATVLDSYVTTSSLWVAQEGTRAWPFGYCQKMGDFTQKSTEYDPSDHHCGICIVLHPLLSRRFRTNDRQLQFRRLPHKVYSDMLFATTVSRRGNRCAQIFATDFCWSCSFSMKLESEVHKVLSLLFQWDGVPPTVICNNAKEMILGEFNRKLKEASCPLKQM